MSCKEEALVRSATEKKKKKKKGKIHHANELENAYAKDSMTGPWKRLLWLKQPYPDTYTDPSFLANLSRLRGYQKLPRETSSYSQVALDFLKFYHRLLNTSLFYVIFSCFYQYHYSPIPFTALLTLLAFVVSFFFKNRSVQLKSSIIIIFTMLTLSPVLKSLSSTTSSDSIWTLSCWLTVIYVLAVSTTSSSIVPTNLLLANVIVLASRLDTTTEVFCFLLICVEINILLPNLESWCIKKGYNWLYAISFFLNHLVVYCFVTYALGWTYTLTLIIMAFAFVVVSPRYFIYWQRHYYKGDKMLSDWDAKIPILE